MRIIISHYRHFISGGPERYLFAVMDYLQKKGHTVANFSVQSTNNIASEWSSFFMSPIGTGNETYFYEYPKDIKTILKVLARSSYSVEGFRKAGIMAREFQPDIVYCLQYLNKMSPSVIDGFSREGVPVVVRLSDFAIMCPNDHLLNKNEICERCIRGNYLHCIGNRCVKGSYAGSAIKAFSWFLHRAIKVHKRVGAFICPSRFTARKLVESGMDSRKVFYVPTFAEPKVQYSSHGDYILYVGRFSPEKGVAVLLNAYAMIEEPKPPLVLVGARGDEKSNLAGLLSRCGSKVRIVDFADKKIVESLIEKAAFVVVPSLWYENSPNVILEAYAWGKPVIASDLGSLVEMVTPDETGLLFRPGDTLSLVEAMEKMTGYGERLLEMGNKALQYLSTVHSKEAHYRQLMEVFKIATGKSNIWLENERQFSSALSKLPGKRDKA